LLLDLLAQVFDAAAAPAKQGLALRLGDWEPDPFLTPGSPFPPRWDRRERRGGRWPGGWGSFARGLGIGHDRRPGGAVLHGAGVRSGRWRLIPLVHGWLGRPRLTFTRAVRRRGA